MRFAIPWMLFCSILILATELHAQTDITEEFRDYFSERFSGSTTKGDKRWDYTKQHKVSLNGLTLASARIGHEIVASGSVNIGELQSSSGSMHLLEIAGDSPFAKGPAVGTNMRLVFDYEGTSSAVRLLHPQSIVVDEPWGELHPGGKVIVALDAESGTNWSLNLYYSVNQGHDDRPGEHIADLVFKLADKARDIVVAFAKSRHLSTEVRLANNAHRIGN